MLTDTTKLDIPEEEIYTYQVEGLAAPHINKPYKNYNLKKAIFILVILVSVGLSMYFSLYILRSDAFTFKELADGNYQFTKFSNPGYIDELTIDYVMDITYPEGKAEEKNYITVTDAPDTLPKGPFTTEEELMAYHKYLLLQEQKAQQEAAKNRPNFEIVYDEEKPVTSIKEFAINGDGYIKTIYIGKNVTEIDGKAFYSCWALQKIIVDEENPNYCDIDGVLYSKDKKTVICYPCDRDQYLREKYSYPKEMWKWIPEDSNRNPLMTEEDYRPIFEKYSEKVMTYVIPPTVETVGELCFNYSNLATVYLPASLTRIENLGFFEMPNAKDFYTYTNKTVIDTSFEAAKGLDTYISLPEGLTYIGTDAFSYNKEMDYIYIPSSVEYIGHHAFWESCYESDGNIAGLKALNIGLSEEEFKAQVETGDQWTPIYNHNLLKKIPVNYGAQRITE